MRLLKNRRLRRTPFHRTYPSRSDFVMDHVDRRMAVDRERGFIYFRIPKAANSTICYRLARQKDPTTDNADDAKRSFMRGSDLTWDEVNNLKDRYYLFAFVRDPYSRIASAYLDKVERMKPRQQRILFGLQKDKHTPLSFLEFCRYLDRGGLYDDPHWFPQVAFVPFGVSSLNSFYFVERLDEEFSALMSDCSLGAVGFSGPRESWAPHKTSAGSSLELLYCGESLKIVQSLYERDFASFGFECEVSWM